MELAPGGDLCSFVSANGGRLTDLDTRVILRQLILAVQYLHSVGIVHRDIKPENILMMNTAVGYRVVLTDFGCAANLRAMSRMESLVGTFDYVAPYVFLHKARLNANTSQGSPSYREVKWNIIYQSCRHVVSRYRGILLVDWGIACFIPRDETYQPGGYYGEA